MLRRRAEARPSARWRRWAPLLAAGLATLAVTAARASADALPEAAVQGLLALWQARLEDHLAALDGDPAALARQPLLRSAQQSRPTRIVFRVNDAGASVPGRDGHDLSGLLLDPPDGLASGWLLFVVAAVERQDERPVALAEVRLVARRQDQPVWQSGPGDAQALATLAASGDPTTALRFPADRHRFRVENCAPWLCVREVGSGAVWRIRLDAAAQATP